MSDTPRTDAEIGLCDHRKYSVVSANFARQLERELAETKRLREAAEKVSANIVDGQSMRVSIKDLIALKDTVAALNKEQSCS
jgi:hypothetical protein